MKDIWQANKEKVINRIKEERENGIITYNKLSALVIKIPALPVKAPAIKDCFTLLLSSITYYSSGESLYDAYKLIYSLT